MSRCTAVCALTVVVLLATVNASKPELKDAVRVEAAVEGEGVMEAEEEAAEERQGRWMLLPGGGDGRAQVAVLEGVDPRRIPSSDTVSFLLWTRSNPRSAERLRLSGRCSAEAPRFRRFDARRPSVLLVHGFGDSARESYMFPTLRDAFLETGDFNVLAADWAALAAAPWYATAASNTVRAAVRVGELLAALEVAGADLRRFHLMGFSLGAHVAGLAAAHAVKLGANRVGRITGLDPAQVLLSAAGPTRRLDRSHAARVDVVHTSGGYLAFLAPLGHRDFFPNGGAWPQPGCTLDFAGTCRLPRHSTSTRLLQACAVIVVLIITTRRHCGDRKSSQRGLVIRGITSGKGTALRRTRLSRSQLSLPTLMLTVSTKLRKIRRSSSWIRTRSHPSGDRHRHLREPEDPSGFFFHHWGNICNIHSLAFS